MAITLKAARVNKGYNQIAAAKLLGISVDTLRNYENYKSFPDIQVLKKIEKVYNVEYSDINFLPENNG